MDAAFVRPPVKVTLGQCMRSMLTQRPKEFGYIQLSDSVSF